nr:hypothetical protein [Tanacetum cinerariifolium]
MQRWQRGVLGLMRYGHGSRIGWTLNKEEKFVVKDLSRLVDDKWLQVNGSGQETMWNKLAPKKGFTAALAVHITGASQSRKHYKSKPIPPVLAGSWERIPNPNHLITLSPVWGCNRLVSRAKVIENQVMATSVISISSDLSKDSIGTPAGRVMLFDTIPTTIPDTTPVIDPPTTETPIVAPTIPLSPDYSPASEAESDPSEDSASCHIPPLPAISPFLSSDNDTTDSDTPDTPPSPTHDTTFTEITASTKRSPVIPRRRVMILSPGQPIPHWPSRKRRRSPITSVPTLPLISRALSHVCTDLIPPSKRVKDIGYFADVEVDPRETKVERVAHPAMPEDIPEPAQEGATEVTYETLGDLVQRFHDHTQAIPVYRIQTIEGVQREHGRRIVLVESTVIALTEKVAELERDNQRLRGTASVE